ncbi:hypothetical protein GCM10010387_49960 [Streptomyces inusitatus]|uniref:Uncharacterized protein n=1 Tax=Streptomyces inusitatus TaxID=68221 RepID=A0A918QJB8_9ACTN|nr:hypothetical protein [Streptomyces inusitatus]GGZ49696.1 hypothetical protein GCM10010387_49960 [Streptomyces inusitatus]
MLDWTADGHAYRAEPTEFIPVSTVTTSTPALAHDVELPGSWWAGLKSALHVLARVPTDRESVCQGWIDCDSRHFLDIDPIRITAWTTGSHRLALGERHRRASSCP